MSVNVAHGVWGHVAIGVAIVFILLNVLTRPRRPARVGLLLGALGAVLYAAAGTARSDYRIGTPVIPYNKKLAAAYLAEGESIHVLDTSFEEGRGIVVADSSKHGLTLLASDAWEALSEYELTKNGTAFARGSPWRQPEEEMVCPAGECQPTEHGGFITNADPHQIVFCESHSRRLLTWSVIPKSDAPDDRSPSPAPVATRLEGIPLDAVAVADDTIVVALSSEGDASSGQPRQKGSLVVYRGGTI